MTDWIPKSTHGEDGKIIQKYDHVSTGEVMQWIIDTKDEPIRNALIQIGWTPPKDKQDD